jgi:hypothetical protein
MENALLPEFDHCGIPGKKRMCNNLHALKKGRASKVERLTGDSTRMKIDDTTKEYFRRGIKLFYENADNIL